MLTRSLQILLPVLLINSFSSTAVAEAQTTPTTKSISYSAASTLDKSSRDTQLKQAEFKETQTIDKQSFRLESTSQSLSGDSSSYSNPDFSIYDADVELISDFDYDGFYHRFSVSIDADTLYNTAYVYAKLYLSYEGGPWTEYAISDNYHIYGNSELDRFVVETELADGFAPGHYDIRIELFDADTHHWLLSYGPYDDISLGTVPLEDSLHDDAYESVYVPIEAEVHVTGRGSMHAWLLMLPAILFAARRFTRDQSQQAAGE